MAERVHQRGLLLDPDDRQTLWTQFAFQPALRHKWGKVWDAHAVRHQVQPVNLPNCGSVFKNPRPKFSAELIEAAGLKGTTIGGAQISPMHANFIVNISNARAGDVISLMNVARKKVFDANGIILEPEVQLVGFKENPILPL